MVDPAHCRIPALSPNTSHPHTLAPLLHAFSLAHRMVPCLDTFVVFMSLRCHPSSLAFQRSLFTIVATRSMLHLMTLVTSLARKVHRFRIAMTLRRVHSHREGHRPRSPLWTCYVVCVMKLAGLTQEPSSSRTFAVHPLAHPSPLSL